MPPGWWCRRTIRCAGNFLAFDLDDAAGWQARLAAAGIVTDSRGRRLRFGFGLYHTGEEVDRLLDRLRRLPGPR